MIDLTSSGAASPILCADPNSTGLCLAVENIAHLGLKRSHESCSANFKFTWDQIALQTNITAVAHRQDIIA
jgi:hypothetical protein